MHLPQKIQALRRATIFNKEIKRYAIKELKKDKTYLNECIKKDIKENFIFRNYQDYMISVILERDGILNRLKPTPLQNFFTSKEVLKLYRTELAKIPSEYKIKKVGVFDTETTDITGYIVSYAFVTQNMDNFETEEQYELINPKSSISKEAYEVHKISEEELKDKPTFKDKKDFILTLFNNVDMIVGHNVFYDFGVLKRELERVKHFPNLIDIPIFDTMFFSWDIVILDKKKQPRLEEAVAFFLGNQNANYHNALEDVKMTLKVFNKLMEIKL